MLHKHVWAESSGSGIGLGPGADTVSLESHSPDDGGGIGTRTGMREGVKQTYYNTYDYSNTQTR